MIKCNVTCLVALFLLLQSILAASSPEKKVKQFRHKETLRNTALLKRNEKSRFNEFLQKLEGGEAGNYQILRNMKLIQGKVNTLSLAVDNKGDNIAKKIFRDQMKRTSDLKINYHVKNLCARKILGDNLYKKKKNVLMRSLTSEVEDIQHGSIFFLTEGIYAYESKNALFNLLEKDDLYLQYIIAKQLTFIGDDSGKNILISCLNSNNDKLKVGALKALQRLDDPVYLSETYKLLKKSNDIEVLCGSLEVIENSFDTFTNIIADILAKTDFINISDESEKRNDKILTFYRLTNIIEISPVIFLNENVYNEIKSCLKSNENKIVSASLRVLKYRKSPEDFKIFVNFLHAEDNSVRGAALHGVRAYPAKKKKTVSGTVIKFLNTGDDFLKISAILFFYETFDLKYGSPYNAAQRKIIIKKIRKWYDKNVKNEDNANL